MWRMTPIDLETVDPPTRERLITLADFFSALDPKRVEEHADYVSELPSGIGDAEHQAEPGIFSLIAYGEPGLHQLLHIALSSDTHRIGWWVPEALLSVCLARPEIALRGVEYAQRYITRPAFEELCSAIRDTCNSPKLQILAREQFSRIIMVDLTRGDLSRIATFIGGRVSLRDDGPRVAQWVINVVARSALKISDSTVAEFEQMVAADHSESIYQSFLEEHPGVLDPLASEIVNRQALAEQWRSDFVIRRLDDGYIFVEIEKPRSRVLLDYPAPTSELSHAIAQVINWLIWVEDNIAYAQAHGFPGIHSPRGVVVIGRDSDLSLTQRRFLKGLNDQLAPRVAILTFDDVLANAKNLLRSTIGQAAELLPGEGATPSDGGPAIPSNMQRLMASATSTRARR